MECEVEGRDALAHKALEHEGKAAWQRARILWSHLLTTAGHRLWVVGACFQLDGPPRGGCGSRVGGLTCKPVEPATLANLPCSKAACGTCGFS